MQGRVRVVVVVVRNLAVSVVTEGGVGVLEIRGVRRVRGGEGVARRNCLFHVELSIFASRHDFYILDLGLTTFWFFFFSLSSLNFRHAESRERAKTQIRLGLEMGIGMKTWKNRRRKRQISRSKHIYTHREREKES